jgi:hypothetical protein
MGILRSNVDQIIVEVVNELQRILFRIDRTCLKQLERRMFILMLLQWDGKEEEADIVS